MPITIIFLCIFSRRASGKNTPAVKTTDLSSLAPQALDGLVRKQRGFEKIREFHGISG
ncbi:MAG TPA: hypothetical protein VGK00_10255 [Anaerolineales bacterium]|jgi:hypothetical protein